MLISTGAKTVLEIISQKSVTHAPQKKHAGIATSGFAVLAASFTICGTAMPTKDTGPAKAVTHALSMLEHRIRSILKAFMFTPELRA